MQRRRGATHGAGHRDLEKRQSAWRLAARHRNAWLVAGAVAASAACGHGVTTLLNDAAGADVPVVQDVAPAPTGEATPAPTLVINDGNQAGVAPQPDDPADAQPLPPGVVRLALRGCCVADYYATVQLGGAASSLLLDTGSATAAAALQGCVGCDDAATFVPDGALGAAATATYADGAAWQGNVVTTTLAFGGAAKPVTAAVGLRMVGIGRADDFFRDYVCQGQNALAFDGILGLGPDALLTAGTDSALTQLAATQALAADVISFQHCPMGGQLWLGGYNPNVTVQAPSYTPMLQTGSFANHYSVAPTALRLSLYQDAAFVDNFGGAFFEGQHAYQRSRRDLTPAQLDAALPPLTFVVPNADGGGDSEVVLPATSAYLLATRDANGTYWYTPQVAPPYNDDTPPLWGNGAMRAHVVIFDRQNKRVGFAPHGGCAQVYPTPTLQ